MVRRKSFVHQQKLMVAGFLVTILALIAYLTLETVSYTHLTLPTTPYV